MTTQRTINVRIPAQQMRQRIYALPGILSGRLADPTGGEIARGFTLRVSATVMAFVKEAYAIKARGGTDAAGEKWKPLAPRTIQHRMRKGKNRPITRRRQRAREAMWRAGRELRKAKTFRNTLRSEERIDAARRKFKAAQKEYAAAVGSIEILRDTGRLFNSLSPGYGGRVMSDGALDVRPGIAVFGTNVKYAKYHHFGTKRCPQRRLWPVVERWPGVWWEDVRGAAQRGLRLAMEQHLRAAI